MNKQKTPIIEVKAHGVEVDANDATRVRAHIARALRPFSAHIRSVIVRLTDLNGPRGGDADLECRIVVDGIFPPVVVSERAGSAGAAIDVAADRVSRAVARVIGRHRTQMRRFG